MMEERADGPLHHWDKTANQIAESFTGTFFLNSTLHILTDTTLEVVGPAHGGTCAELLLVRMGTVVMIFMERSAIDFMSLLDSVGRFELFFLRVIL